MFFTPILYFPLRSNRYKRYESWKRRLYLQGKDRIDNTKIYSRTLLRFKFPYLSSVWQMYSSSTLWNPGVTLGFSNQPRIIQTKLTFVPLSKAEIHSQFFEIHENMSQFFFIWESSKIEIPYNLLTKTFSFGRWKSPEQGARRNSIRWKVIAQNSKMFLKIISYLYK